MTNPFVSIIIPTFNSGKTLSDCLDSVFSQTYDRYEILVIDGGSSDNTLSLLEQFATRHPGKIKRTSEKDSGIYDAMNKGVTKASGEWLYFLGSDDALYDKDVLMDMFGTRPKDDLMLLYGHALVLPQELITPIGLDFFKLINGNICHQAIFYSKKVFQHWKYDTRLRLLADWDLNLKVFGAFENQISAKDRMIARYMNTGASAGWGATPEYRENFMNHRRMCWKYLPLDRFLKKSAAGIIRRTLSIFGINKN